MSIVKIKETPSAIRHRHDGRDLPSHLLRQMEEGDKKTLAFAKLHFMLTQTEPSRLPTAKLLATRKSRQEFERLVREWKDATQHLSVPRQQIAHPAFLRIIALGDKVLPFIFAHFQQRSSPSWTIALEAIVGDNVAVKASNYKEAVQLWLDWGKAKGYL